MVQPKYNPLESLQRVKLLMKYNTEKTLTENVSTIYESNDPPEKMIQVQFPKEVDIMKYDLQSKKGRQKLAQEMTKRGYTVTYRKEYGLYVPTVLHKPTGLWGTIGKRGTWAFNYKLGKIKDVNVTVGGIMVSLLVTGAAVEYLFPSGKSKDDLRTLLEKCNDNTAPEIGRRSDTVLSGTEVEEKAVQLAGALNPEFVSLNFGTNFSSVTDALVAKKMKWGDVCRVKEAFDKENSNPLFNQLTDVFIGFEDTGIIPELTLSQMIKLVAEIRGKFTASEVTPSEFSTGEGWLNNFKCLKSNEAYVDDLEAVSTKGIMEDQVGNYYIKIKFRISDTSPDEKLFLLRSDGTVCEYIPDVSKNVPKELCKLNRCTDTNMSWGTCDTGILSETINSKQNVIIESGGFGKIHEQPPVIPKKKQKGTSGSSGTSGKGDNNQCSAGYAVCDKEYKPCCTSPQIAKFKFCAGFIKNQNSSNANNWGPKTSEFMKNYMSGKYKDKFTDSDVAEICKESTVKPVETKPTEEPKKTNKFGKGKPEPLDFGGYMEGMKKTVSKSLIVNELERQRILEMHKRANKNYILFEQTTPENVIAELNYILKNCDLSEYQDENKYPKYDKTEPSIVKFTGASDIEYQFAIRVWHPTYEGNNLYIFADKKQGVYNPTTNDLDELPIKFACIKRKASEEKTLTNQDYENYKSQGYKTEEELLGMGINRELIKHFKKSPIFPNNKVLYYNPDVTEISVEETDILSKSKDNSRLKDLILNMKLLGLKFKSTIPLDQLGTYKEVTILKQNQVPELPQGLKMYMRLDRNLQQQVASYLQSISSEFGQDDRFIQSTKVCRDRIKQWYNMFINKIPLQAGDEALKAEVQMCVNQLDMNKVQKFFSKTDDRIKALTGQGRDYTKTAYKTSRDSSMYYIEPPRRKF